MTSTLKIWTNLGLATALAGTTLAGCSSEGGEAGEEGEEITEVAASGEMGAGEGGEAGESGEGGETGHEVATMPLPHRIAFMSGHVEAGLALYRAGDAEAAAPHLLHPVSETHAAERAGLDELGFDAALFEAVSKALEEGVAASEIEGQLKAAEENLAGVREKAGGDVAETITFLMGTIVEEYTIAVTDGAVTDPGEYQDAYGFAVVAKELAGSLEGDTTRLNEELDTLIGMWPEAPIPPSDPKPVAQVSAMTSRVALALPGE